MRDEIFPEFLRPHLQIYLDIPVDLVQKRIKERGHDYEINGKALTKPFLEAMEEAYKKIYLPEIELVLLVFFFFDCVVFVVIFFKSIMILLWSYYFNIFSYRC